MERRSFIKGVFGGVTAGGIILASGEDDIAAFVSQVQRNEPMVACPEPLGVSQVAPGEMLFNHLGRPVAIIREVQWHADVQTIAKMSDAVDRSSMHGIYAVIMAVSYGPASMKVSGVQ